MVAAQFLNCKKHFLFEYFISPKATCPFVLSRILLSLEIKKTVLQKTIRPFLFITNHLLCLYFRQYECLQNLTTAQREFALFFTSMIIDRIWRHGASIGARNSKVLDLIPHGDSEFFLCPTLVTRRKTSFFRTRSFITNSHDSECNLK